MHAAATHAVTATGLVKNFGDTEALRGIDLEIERATVLGVLGPNGAGKTTAVRILTTLLHPDAGSATIDGIDVFAHPGQVRARIGVTGQYAAVDERLTGFENLRLVGRLFHLRTSEARTRATGLLERFGLSDAGDRPVKGYSGGMRRRLDIAMSLIGQPSVLFLDEPTTGLDPRSRLAMWDLIDGLVAEGMTTLLTTQYLDEAERLADRIVVIDSGRVIERGTPQELKARVGGERVEITLADSGDLAKVPAVLSDLIQPGAEGSVDEAAARIDLAVPKSDGIVPAVVRALDAAGIPARDVVVRSPTLDDVFMELTGHHVEDAVPDAVDVDAGGER
ncbi:MAG: ATP-binding cassette domain-containing protein [Acidimicrobiia bacterium]|nr:ATP-binding cassette domain-containing protein [Acidimicrobiia bacterium]